VTPPDEEYQDLLGEHPDPVLMRLVADLDAVHTIEHPDQHHVAAARALERWQHSRKSAQTGRKSPIVSLSRRRRALTGRLRTRFLSLVAAVLVMVSGTLGYLRFSQPTPVSAQVILQRAAGAFASPVPGKVLHQTQTVTITSRSRTDTTTVDQWAQWDARGRIARQVTTFRTASGVLLSRSLLIGQTLRTYTAADNAVRVTRLPSTPLRLTLPLAPVRLDPKQLILAARRHPARDLQLLPRQMLDNHAVDVVGVTGLTFPGVGPLPKASSLRPPRTLFSIDPNTYAIRGIDTIAGSTELRMRVTVDTTMSPSAVPPGTFALHAPGNARVVSGTPGPAGMLPTSHRKPKTGLSL
jgi:hypothetical protein